MFCSRCGTEVQQRSQFCPTCGLDLRSTTPVQAIASGDLTELDIVKEALAEEYEILEELGRGGMAIVYRAREKQLEREVAIKVLPFSLAFDAEFVERFQREARTSAQLEHPNIIPIYRVGKTGRVIYFVMKLLRGQGLSRILLDRKQLSPGEIRRLLVEAGNALGYAAKRGIVHRDIKPDNIMFDEFGQVVVTDFGIAKAATGQKLTGTGMSIGTPHYMSPEQARAQGIDGRSDIYSLGIVAYQCLIGEVPYDGEDSFAIGYKHIMEPIPNPPLSTPEERRLFETIKRMLMKDPRDRFQDADELIRALEAQPMTQAAGAGRASSSRLGASAQPTTPLPALSGDSRSGESDPSPRRPVVRRSQVQRNEGAGIPAWLWVVFVLALAGAGGYYLTILRPAEIAAAARDSATVAVRQDSSGAASLAHPSDSGSHHDSIPPHPADTNHAMIAPAHDSILAVPDTGSLVLTGLPAGSNVLIDTHPVLETVIRLPVGSHELAISAPSYLFFLDTVQITAGEVLRLTPQLEKLGGQPHAEQKKPPSTINCEVPSPSNRFGSACYDSRPFPMGSTRIPLTADIEGTPSASVQLVRVSAAGKTLEVRTRQPSNDPAFERLASEFAHKIEWRPARKGGVAVDGWTQLTLTPDQ